ACERVISGRNATKGFFIFATLVARMKACHGRCRAGSFGLVLQDWSGLFSKEPCVRPEADCTTAPACMAPREAASTRYSGSPRMPITVTLLKRCRSGPHEN